jgi:transcriptional antiterminator Rof (Rho-off)
MNSDYNPVSCDFQDVLEEASIKRKTVRIKATDGREVEGIIEKIFSEDHADFLVCSGEKIRLDQIELFVSPD